MADEVHEDLPTGVIPMTDIKLSEGSGQIISKHSVPCRNRSAPLPLDTPCLIIDLLPVQWPFLRTGIEFLHVLREVRYGVPARLPFGHLKIDERRCFIRGNR